MQVMKPIIVSSYRRDAHADAVLWGLGVRGHPAMLWQKHLFPASQSLSILFEPGAPPRHIAETEQGPVDLAGVRTVWDRRSLPLTLDEDMDPRDREFARRESEQHLCAFLATACPDALWVNPPATARLDTDKPSQIALARRIGFAVPATLFSNSPEEIEDFHERHGRAIVYKSYRPERWIEGEGKSEAFVNHTAPVTEEDIANRRALAMCPGIFQARVAKAYEIRVTAMGKSFFGVRIDPPAGGQGALDWRSDKAGMRLSRFELPADLGSKCRAFMAEAGIVFGCFDFIVTPEGEHVFLEVNPMGQFLWQEERIPDLPLLDAMCAFLASGDRDFEWDETSAPLRFEDYRQWRIRGGASAGPREAASATA